MIHNSIFYYRLKLLTSAFFITEWIVGCGMLKAPTDGCGVDLVHPNAKSSATQINLAVSSTWLNPKTNAKEKTPCSLLTKVKKVAEAWEAASEVPIKFNYLGVFQDRDYYSGRSRVITFQMDGSPSFATGVAGYGRIIGSPGQGYQGGQIDINTGVYGSIAFKTLMHELGHTLGLGHSPHIGATMSCGTPAWGSYDVLGLTLQDYTELMALWAPSTVFTISGRVESTASPGPIKDSTELETQSGLYFYVYAVNVVNGTTFSALSKGDGTFSINIPKIFNGYSYSGSFRVFAQAASGHLFGAATGTVPSWYISDSTSTNDPYGGTVFSIGRDNPAVAGIKIQAIQGTLPWSTFWSGSHKLEADQGSKTANIDCHHSFLIPGEKCLFYLTYLRSAPASIASYGSSPDYSFSTLSVARNTSANVNIDMSYDTTVTIATNASPGDRLVLLYPSGSSYIDAALVGVSVIGKTHPGDAGYYFPAYKMIDSPSDYTVLDGAFFFR